MHSYHSTFDIESIDLQKSELSSELVIEPDVNGKLYECDLTEGNKCLALITLCNLDPRQSFQYGGEAVSMIVSDEIQFLFLNLTFQFLNKSNLDVGYPYYISIKQQQYEYYQVQIITEATVTLQILVTQLNYIGKVTIVCAAGQNRRPTVDSYDWTNQGSSVQELLIGNLKAGWYVIGVYNHNEDKSLQLRISINYGNIYMQRMIEGLPQDLILNQDQPIFLELPNDNPDKTMLKLNFIKQFGDYTVFIDTYKSNLQFLDLVKQIETFKWKWDASDLSNGIFKITESSTGFCKDCGYLVKLVPVGGKCALTFIMTSDDDSQVQLMGGQTLTDQLKIGQTNYYNFYTEIQKEYLIELISLTGQYEIYFSSLFDDSTIESEWKKVNNIDQKKMYKFHHKAADNEKLLLIKVICTEGINMGRYTISLHEKGQVKNLLNGLENYGILEPQEWDKYSFSAYNSNSQIIVESKNCSTQFYSHFSEITNCKFPTIFIYYEYFDQPSIEQPLQSGHCKILKNFFFCNCINSNATYTISLLNKYSETINYGIIQDSQFSQNSVIPISNSNEFIGSLQLEQTQIYEFFSPDYYQNIHYQAMFEIVSCLGTVEGIIGNNLADIKNDENPNNHQLNQNYKYSGHLVDSYELETNPIYLSIKAAEASEINLEKFKKYFNITFDNPHLSIFFTRIQYLKQNEMIGYNFLYPGTKNIYYELKSGMANFTISPIQCIQKNENYFKIYQQTYYLEIYDDLNSLDYSLKCIPGYINGYFTNKMQMNFTNHNILSVPQHIHFFFDISQFKEYYDKPLYVGIRAVLHVEGEGVSPQNLIYFYDSQQIIVPKKAAKYTTMKIVIIILVVVYLIGMAVFIYIYCRRYKLLQKFLSRNKHEDNMMSVEIYSSERPKQKLEFPILEDNDKPEPKKPVEPREIQSSQQIISFKNQSNQYQNFTEEDKDTPQESSIQQGIKQIQQQLENDDDDDQQNEKMQELTTNLTSVQEEEI